MNRKYQIFVSSTFNDLKYERKVAIDTIIKLRQIPAGMELFSATGENQFEMIKPIIYESDYYLLIVAGKYGTICEDTGLSYTEMEYDFAVQNHKRIIAFVNDDPDNLPFSDREVTDKMRRKLKKFRKKVMSNKMVKMWHDKEELFQGISISVSTVIEMYPSDTCWIHVDENDIYTPIGNYIALKEVVEIELRDNVKLYYNNLKETILQLKRAATGLHLIIDVPEKNTEPYIDEFVGCSIRMGTETRDWVRYVLNGYRLLIDYSLKTNEKISIWIEIKGYAIEMYKQVIPLETGEDKQISIYLKDFMEDADDWKKIKEICLVFRPADKRISGMLEVKNVKLGR